MKHVECKMLAPNIDAIDTGNWLTAPFNRVSFRSVRDILPTTAIENDLQSPVPFQQTLVEQADLTFKSRAGDVWTVDKFIDETHSDGLLILHEGQIAYEWYTADQVPADEHIVFSVTKSVIGSLAGVLAEQGQLDPDAPVVCYVPELRNSGYADARVRHLLDMTVSLDFEESYLDSDPLYARYREASGWHPANAAHQTPGIYAFLAELEAIEGQPHGRTFDYMSPNSDLLGWLLERAADCPLANLISDLIWKPMGAESPASITVDRSGAPRAAGGLSCTLRDMARFGECMRGGGAVAGRQVIPREWIKDILSSGDRTAWDRSTLADWVPGGCYRNQWWLTNDKHGAFFAAGIYGQWIYISPGTRVVIVKQASRPAAIDEHLFRFELDALESLACCIAR